MNDNMRSTIGTASECAFICNETLAYCLTMGGEHASKEHITTMLDCAQACELSVALIARKSPYYSEFARWCAQLCDECANSCEKISMGDYQMERCIETCRRCAAECAATA